MILVIVNQVGLMMVLTQFAKNATLNVPPVQELLIVVILAKVLIEVRHHHALVIQDILMILSLLTVLNA